MHLEAGSLIGRSGDVRAVLAALTNSRLVTLTGPGGIGKTRLAKEVASELETEFDRIIFIDLTANDSVPEGSFPQDLTALDLSKTLLLVDNCEHVINEAATKVDGILRGSRETTVLATSRRPLHVAGERLHPVGPLSAPESGEPIADLLTFEAVQLFVERAAQLEPSFELSAANFESVAEICKLSEGLPIAVELAAGMTRSRSIASIAVAMGESQSMSLVLKRRDIHVHQQSLARSVGWSLDLLSKQARQLLRCAAVFQGSFTSESLEVIHNSIGGMNTAALLDLLVEHSLIQFDQTTERFTLLALIANAVRESSSAEMAGLLTHAHSAWALTTSRAIAAKATQPDPLRLFPRFQHDLPDLVAAASNLASARDTESWLELVGPIAEWWVHHGGEVDRVAWETALGDQVGTDPRRVALANGLSFHVSHLGDHEASLLLAQKSNHAATAQGRHDLAIPALIAIGNAHQSIGNPKKAAEAYAEACDSRLNPPNTYLSAIAQLCLARTLVGTPQRRGLLKAHQLAGVDHPAIKIIAEQEMARLELADGNLSEATEWASEGVLTAAQLGFPEAEATAQNTLGSIATVESRFVDAQLAHEAAIKIGQRLGHAGVIADGLVGLARILMARNSADSAYSVAKLALELAPKTALPPSLDQAAAAPGEPLVMGDLEQLLTTMSRDPQIDAEESVAQAILTDRETSVLLLLRGDLTQREIADELYISPSTVRTHVKSIYRKLEVHNRTSCVHHATVLGLLPAP